MSKEKLALACDSIFESPSPTLTIEFQGGDPLLRFDLIEFAIERITSRNIVEKRDIRFVIASTLHQLNAQMCGFFKTHGALLSTSIDGPENLHNRNRPISTKDAFGRTLRGIEMARALISDSVVSALMTTTRESLLMPEAIVDTYVDLKFREIFIRPLSGYGFARRNSRILDYTADEFHNFYKRAFNRILDWNRRGTSIREVGASIILNKILSPFDAGYVDLQTPTGAGLAVLVYNFDGYVYPSDEARMLAASGDTSLRLGCIGDSLDSLLDSQVQRDLLRASASRSTPGCSDCVYNVFCGPDPVASYNELGSLTAPVWLTQHCQRHLWLFDFFFDLLYKADSWFEELAYSWAQPGQST